MTKSSLPDSVRVFRPDCTGQFIERPNRFLIKALVNGHTEEVHCPNPGRLRELLIPGREIILEKAESTGKKRKTRFTLAGIRYRNSVVPLYSARANGIAESLILPRLFPEIMEIKREVVRGESRFDFHLRLTSGEMLVEVKACTLSEEGTAMFPDSPTARGRRHVDELSRMTTTKCSGVILFIIMQPDTERFVPNIHTDPDFCRSLILSDARLRIHAVSVHGLRSGIVRLHNLAVPIDLGLASHHLSGGGTYLLVIELKNDTRATWGGHECFTFYRGFYVYVGSGMRNLDQRIARHLRKTKNKRWHIDSLTQKADSIVPLPIRSAHRMECRLAGDLSEISEGSIPSFGSSDCRCRSHLFRFTGSPLGDYRFISLLLRYRHGHALTR